MKILLLISLIYIVLFILLCVLSQLVRVDASRDTTKLLMFLLIISLSVVAFFSTDNTNGTTGWDINRYYADINKMRGRSIAYAYRNGLYKTSYVTNFLFFIVSRLNNNAWLQVISTSASVMMLTYVILSKAKADDLIFSDVALYMLLIFSFVGFSVMLMGVRWILALSTSALAVNIEERKKSNKLNILSILLYLIAFFTHYGIIFFILIRLCSIGHFKWVKYVLPFLLLAVSSMNRLSQYSEVFSMLYDRLETYTGVNVQDTRVMIVQYTLFFILLLIEIRQRYRDNNSLSINILSGTLGTVPVQYLFTRMLSVYVVITPNKLLVETKNDNLLRYLITFLCLGLLAYQLVFVMHYWRFTV